MELQKRFFPNFFYKLSELSPLIQDKNKCSIPRTGVSLGIVWHELENDKCSLSVENGKPAPPPHDRRASHMRLEHSDGKERVTRDNDY